MARPQFPPQQYPYQYVMARRTNGMAIASLVLGLLWIGGVGAFLAIIFSAVALRQIDERGDDGKGMAIAGLVLGIVGVLGVTFIILLLHAASTSADKFNSIGASLG